MTKPTADMTRRELAQTEKVFREEALRLATKGRVASALVVLDQCLSVMSERIKRAEGAISEVER